MKISFYKMVATGNDFVMVDNKDKIFPVEDKDYIERICKRKYGVGSDGVILIEPSEKANFRMRIFNPDGGEAEMCGNGSRCAVHLAGRLGYFSGNKAKFETMAGTLSGEVDGNLVRIDMGVAKDLKLDFNVEIDGQRFKANFINTGVPHLVIFVDDISKVDVNIIGRKLRFHKCFQPNGTNVNFVEVVNTDEIKVRTYERGVEEETFSCGTGTCASAIISHLVKGCSNKIKSTTAKGENLFVDFDADGNNIEKFYLSGDVKYVYEGVIEY